MMNGIGGDLFLLYWDAKSGKLYGLNVSGWAPEGLTVDFLKNRGLTSMPDAGIYSVTVPGAVDGWAKAHQRLVLRKDYSAMMGRGQAVLHNSATGTNFAASDPRADGSAEPEPTPTK
jgi:gamma-glutamyltranspeptidase